MLAYSSPQTAKVQPESRKWGQWRSLRPTRTPLVSLAIHCVPAIAQPISGTRAHSDTVRIGEGVHWTFAYLRAVYGSVIN